MRYLILNFLVIEISNKLENLGIGKKRKKINNVFTLRENMFTMQFK
jgi:hypothetical protein